MKALPLLTIVLSSLAAPAFANTVVVGAVKVTTPAPGAQVVSPFQLSAADAVCASRSVVAMGYSLDTGTNLRVVKGQTLNIPVTASTGSHVLHVKSWGPNGAACVTNVNITVVLKPAPPVRGEVTVSSPAQGAQVISPFNLSAKDAVCASKSVVAMGYSLDSQTNTQVVRAQSLHLPVNAPMGSHVLHVKSWGSGGAACVTDVNINVLSDPGSAVPSDALVFSGIAGHTNWHESHDDATGSGTTYGDMQMVSSPSLSGSARQFTTTYYDSTGERYSDTFGSDTYTTHFLYDGWIYIASPNSGLANLELDINQVLANGDTMILSFQCDGYSGTWDYGENAGTVQSTQAHWIHSTQKCNPRNWSTDTWHHVQISDQRDDAGNVTYNSVWLDGVQQDINATVPGEFSLGWASVVQTNFQVDGLGASGSTTLYLDKLTVYAW